MILTLREEGDAGLNGGPAGDLYVYVRVKEDQIFKRMVTICTWNYRSLTQMQC